ncbi:hypothetical protein JQ596_14710 [Bradyrhizobium manausense]|uniref:hypothetical protein n=1 Tax=Bradyrhizobium TaxID=374 RepID=UPI001BAC5A8B|nr:MULTISPECIES: hypothetical protein [Bradyrhizobium]MBR0826799.1 hypothetical protein [Bradyrhizobium manausense]UVO32085.1 hypothetical protein KUF59_16370 [Bradyrhizobium arachidis]
MSELQYVILGISVAYAIIGALLLLVLVYARLHWSLKAVAVVVTSAFYVISFMEMRGLLGWATTARLPPSFKLLHARIVEPHTLQGEPGAIYLWVEELDEDNRPSAIPRAYRMPYSDALADKTHTAENEIKAGRPQGGRAADFGGGDGSIIDMVREYVTPKIILETTGGDSSTGEFKMPTDTQLGAVFTPLPPPRMPPKDEQ